ncbi:MAG: hypothetical protein K0S02_2202 [Achromobacter mucicolens]|jgi:hypothetical protein|nr:hypothetical protein [Achromobacter mucicolens]
MPPAREAGRLGAATLARRNTVRPQDDTRYPEISPCRAP